MGAPPPRPRARSLRAVLWFGPESAALDLLTEFPGLIPELLGDLSTEVVEKSEGDAVVDKGVDVGPGGGLALDRILDGLFNKSADLFHH